MFMFPLFGPGKMSIDFQPHDSLPTDPGHQFPSNGVIAIQYLSSSILNTSDLYYMLNVRLESMLLKNMDYKVYNFRAVVTIKDESCVSRPATNT
jgi:hypothetical protein